MNFAGWPFAAVYGPLQALFGTVAGWNLFVLLTYVGAGGFAALWLRALGLPLGAALVGRARVRPRALPRRAVDRAPARADLDAAPARALRRRATEDAGSPPPRSRRSRSPARCTSPSARSRSCSRTRSRGGGRGSASSPRAPASRRRASSGRSPCATPSSGRSRRSSATRRRSATSSRRDPGEFERFVYLGWLLPCSRSPASGACVFRNTSFRSRRLALVLGLGALVPCLLALGANLPGYGLLWRNTPLHATRVPERLLPIACLCLAALVAAAIACVSETQVALGSSRASSRGRARRRGRPLGAALRPARSRTRRTPSTSACDAAPPGRLLEVPPLPPDAYAGSVYLYYAMQAPRERPLGYSTSAPPEAPSRRRAVRRSAGARARRQRRRPLRGRHGRPSCSPP